MKTTTSNTSSRLGWRQTHSLPRAFELRDGESVVASLRWQRVFRTLAIGDAPSGQFEFERAGFLRPRVRVRARSGTPFVAEVPLSWCGGATVELPGGRTYRWSKTSFWRSEWMWSDGSGVLLVSIRPVFAGLRRGGEVRPTAAGRDCPDLAFLSLLGWYLLVLHQDDTAVVVTAAVS